MSKTQIDVGNNIFIDADKLKTKGLLGKVMWQIAFCQSYNCQDKDAFIKLLEYTANEIIKQVCHDQAKIRKALEAR